MDIVLLGFFTQLVMMYAVILFSDYRKSIRSKATASVHAIAPAAKTLTVVVAENKADEVRRRA